MSDQDSYGQGVSIATLTDAPNAEKLARNLADTIVQRSIMRFASASERNATLSGGLVKPVAGMMAWLDTEKLLTQYDGSTWAVVAAGTQSWTDLTLASGYTADGNSNGTPQWRLVNLFGEPTVMFRGGVGLSYPSGSLPNNGVINSVPLPTNARTTTLRTITCACSVIGTDWITSLKLDLQPEGYLRIVGADATHQPPWISLNGAFCSL